MVGSDRKDENWQCLAWFTCTQYQMDEFENGFTHFILPTTRNPQYFGYKVGNSVRETRKMTFFQVCQAAISCISNDLIELKNNK